MKRFLILFLLFATRAFSQAVPATYPYPTLLPTTGAMSGGVLVTGPLRPSNYADNRAVVWDDLVGGGFRSVQSIAERDSIINGRRKEGMWVFVSASSGDAGAGHIYALAADLVTWYDLGAAVTGSLANADTSIYKDSGILDENREISGTNSYSITFKEIPNYTITAGNLVQATSPNIYLDGTTSIEFNRSVSPLIFKRTPTAINNTEYITVKDPATGEFKTSTTTIASLQAGVSASGNIYTTNGTLSGNRTLSGGGFNLTMNNIAAYTLNNSGAYQVLSTASITQDADVNQTLSAGSILSLGAPDVKINNGANPYIFKTSPTTAASGDYIVFRNSAGEVRYDASVTKASLGASTTLYSANGSLAGDRVVEGAGYNLSFTNIDTGFVSAGDLWLVATNVAVIAAPGTSITGTGSLTIKTPNVYSGVTTVQPGQYLQLQNTTGGLEYAPIYYTSTTSGQTGSTYTFSNAQMAPDFVQTYDHPVGTVAYLTFNATSVGADAIKLGPSTTTLGIVHHDGSVISAGELLADVPYTFVKVGTGGSAKWLLQGHTSATTYTPLLNRSAVVATVADLVALDPIRFNFASTKGYYAADDGGAGMYHWVSNQTSTNRGSKIASASSGSWVLIPETAGISVKAFGAKGDVGIAWLRNTGTPITPTDDKVAIQEAVNWCGENGIPMLVPNGRYHIGSTITNRSATGVVIKGVTQNQSLAAQNGVVNTPQSMFVRSGNYTLFQFAGALTTAEMSAGYYTQSWQKYVQVSDMLFEDTYTAPTTTAPMIVMKRSVLSRWNRVSFIGVNSTVLDLWTADDGIFTDCRWMSCGYYDKPAILLHRNETDGSEHIYSTINTLTFTDCVFEYNYNASIYTSRSGIGDNGNINFNGTQFKQHRPINPVPVVDMYRTDGLNFHDTILSFGTDNIVTNKTLSSFVHLESCRADGKLNIAQLTHSAFCVVTNAVRIVDPRGGRLEIDVSSGLTGALAGDVLVRVDTTTDSYYNFSLNGRSSINSDLSDLGAFGGKPFSNHPTGEFAKNAEHGRKLSAGAAFNGAFYYTAVLTGRTLSTNDFTVTADVQVPSTTGTFAIWNITSNSVPAGGVPGDVMLEWNGGVLRLVYINASSTVYILSSTEQILQKIYAGRTVSVTVVRRSGSYEIWFDNAKLQLTGTQPANTLSLPTTAYIHVGRSHATSSYYSRQRIASVALYNYALEYVDILSYRNFGINETDKWVVATANPLSATFDTTTESFSIEDGGSLTANGVGQMTFTLPASGASKATRTASVNGIKNKRHRISVNAWNTSGTPTVLTAGLRSNSSTDTTTNSSVAFTPTGTSAWYTGIVGPAVQNEAAVRIGVTAGNSSVYLIDGVVIEQLGCIGAWQFDESGITANDLVGVADMLSTGASPTVSSFWAAPRMTTTLRNLIPNKSAGVVVFDTTESKLYVYSGSAWEKITSVP